jgi:hypothetical protein
MVEPFPVEYRCRSCGKWSGIIPEMGPANEIVFCRVCHTELGTREALKRERKGGPP